MHKPPAQNAHKAQSAHGGRFPALHGTAGFFLAWIVFPILPVLVIQPFVAYSCLYTLPFYVLIGFLCLKSRFAAIYLAFFLTFVNLVLFLSISFRLAISDTVLALFRDSGQIRIFADPLYTAVFIAGIISVSGTAFLAWRYRPRPHALKIIGLMYLVLGLDALSTFNYGYALGKGLPVPGTPETFTSAMRDSGLEGKAFETQRPLLLVIVEALGRFNDPSMEDAVMTPLFTQTSHDIHRGHLASYGSTTAAEVRELCGVSGTHGALLDGEIDTGGCLPARLRSDGRKTVAVHGYKSSVFDRNIWYPELGFEKILFSMSALPGDSKNRCSSVFRGPCDFEVAETVAAELRRSPAPFVYWLTLNSHIPAYPHPQLSDPFRCEEAGGMFESEDVCALAVIWYRVMEDVARMARENPDADILVVGDHPPPVMSRRGRALFSGADVPWIRLAPKQQPDPDHPESE